MENKSIIQEELINISPLLAAMPKVNVYVAPPDYFTNFSKSINTLFNTTGFMDDVAKYNPSMQVPEGYFDQLAAAVLTKIKINQHDKVAGEDGELSFQLKELQSIHVYQTPLNYFENLSESLLKNIAEIENNPRIETESISSTLSNIDKRNVLEVPANYFDQLPQLLLQKSKPVAKIVSLQKPNLFIRYAVAAVLIGAISFVVLQFTNKPSGVKDSYAVVESNISKGLTMDDKKFNEALSNLSEDDIAAYLQKNGTDADLAILSSVIEEDKIPAEEDYLSDDKTLERFLNEIDTKKLNN